MGWEVHEVESATYSAKLVERLVQKLEIVPDRLTLHSDNGGPMRGATMLQTLRSLGVAQSFSRAQVSDDNPYVESLFRTLKCRPNYPRRPCASIENSREWVDEFVHWYNTQHSHSALNDVTPADRYAGRDVRILAERKRVYAKAKRGCRGRWSGAARDWAPGGPITLNPRNGKSTQAV